MAIVHYGQHVVSVATPKNFLVSRTFFQVLATIFFFAGVFVVPAGAEATTCRSKPSVCRRLNAQEKQRATKSAKTAKDETVAPVTSTPGVPTQRCNSKPAVCSLIVAGEKRAASRAVAAAEPTAQAVSAPVTKRCISKPAVCSRLKHRYAR